MGLVRYLSGIALIFWAVGVGSQASYSANVSELKRLQKCYAIFVKQRIQTTDPLWTKVSTGTLSGTDACMQVLDTAKLNTSGTIAKTNGVYNEVGSRVLASFLEFNRGQFMVPDYASGLTANMRPTADVTDSNEPAYHYLYSLFAPNEPFSNVVERKTSLIATRSSSNGKRTRQVLNMGTELEFAQGNVVYDNSTPKRLVIQDALPWAVTTAQAGSLVGIVPDTRANILTDPPNQNKAFTKNKNVNEHFGAGFLGTQAYLIGNNDKAGPATGGLNSFRLWSKNVLSDVLCRTVPALRSSDVLHFVKVDSKLPFRQGISCMQCHASMDPMAGAIRNIRLGNSVNDGVSGAKGVRFYTHDPNANTKPAADYPVMGEDSDFYKRPTDTTLMYRSYDGSLINVSMSGLDDLGRALASTNDMYVCAAKNYFSFLTGITVDLSDLEDPINAPSLTSAQLAYRNKVISLGLQLKSDQSLRSLIKNIISSDTFIYPDSGK